MLETYEICDEYVIYKIKSPTSFIKFLHFLEKEYDIGCEKDANLVTNVYFNGELLLSFSPYINMARVPTNSQFIVMLRKQKLQSL